jgi:hypothetical protein
MLVVEAVVVIQQIMALAELAVEEMLVHLMEPQVLQILAVGAGGLALLAVQA